jgi:hypothetical protein
LEFSVLFDIWFECERVSRNAIAAYLHRLDVQPPVAEPDSKRMSGHHMTLNFLGRSWKVVDAFRVSPAPWVQAMTVYQEGIVPERVAVLDHCELHDLHYAGVIGWIGCPVCNVGRVKKIEVRLGPEGSVIQGTLIAVCSM